MSNNTHCDNRFWRDGAYTGAPAATVEDNAVVASLRELEESRLDYTGHQLTQIERLLRRAYEAGLAAKVTRRRRKVTMPMATTAVVAVNGKGE
jgi:hypothetical protein